MATRVRSFCKINLGLAVGPTRPDGYHGLTTCYQTLALHDVVTVAAKPSSATEITLEANHPAVPSTARGDGERNTATKMVSAALKAAGIQAQVHITIRKSLPVQGGLGAGSANAVAAMLGLERELGLALPGPARLALAAEVGSDVPLFLLGGTVLGLDRGESVFPLPDSRPLAVVVAIPSVGVSTAQAFRDLDAQMAREQASAGDPDLTFFAPTDKLKQLSRVLASPWTHTGAKRVATGIATSSPLQPAGGGDLPKGSGASASLHDVKGDLAENHLLALVRAGVENDFESVAFRQHPSLRDIKQALLGENTGSSDSGPAGAHYAALSGSGSALFGIYGSSDAARAAQQRVQALGTRALLTQTLPRHEYWQRMFA